MGHINLPRLSEIQLMKSVAMVLVIYGHLICPYTHYTVGTLNLVPFYDSIMFFLASLHTPCFTYCSGFLFGYLLLKGKYQDFTPFCKNKVMKLLFPWLVYGAMRCFLAGSALLILLQSGFHVWYLLMLFECFMVTWLYNHYICSKKIDSCVLIFCIILTIKIPETTSILSISGFVNQFPFFFTGYFLAKYDYIQIIVNSRIAKYMFIWFLTAIMFLICMCFLRGYYYDSGNFFGAIAGKLIKELPFLVVIIACHVTLIKNQNYLKFHNFWSFIDKYSYRIYLIHPILIILISRYIYPVIGIKESFFESVLWFALIFVCSLFYSVYVEKTILRKIF